MTPLRRIVLLRHRDTVGNDPVLYGAGHQGEGA